MEHLPAVVYCPKRAYCARREDSRRRTILFPLASQMQSAATSKMEKSCVLGTMRREGLYAGIYRHTWTRELHSMSNFRTLLLLLFDESRKQGSPFLAVGIIVGYSPPFLYTYVGFRCCCRYVEHAANLRCILLALVYIAIATLSCYHVCFLSFFLRCSLVTFWGVLSFFFSLKHARHPGCCTFSRLPSNSNRFLPAGTLKDLHHHPVYISYAFCRSICFKFDIFICVEHAIPDTGYTAFLRCFVICRAFPVFFVRVLLPFVCWSEPITLCSKDIVDGVTLNIIYQI